MPECIGLTNPTGNNINLELERPLSKKRMRSLIVAVKKDFPGCSVKLREANGACRECLRFAPESHQKIFLFGLTVKRLDAAKKSNIRRATTTYMRFVCNLD